MLCANMCVQWNYTYHPCVCITPHMNNICYFFLPIIPNDVNKVTFVEISLTLRRNVRDHISLTETQ